MYRLLGFKSVSNARLFLNRRNLIESKNQSFHLLFNQETSLLRLSGELIELQKLIDNIINSKHPVTQFNCADFNNLTWLLTFVVFVFFFQNPAGVVQHQSNASSGLSSEMVQQLIKKKKKRYKKYTELLQGKWFDCISSFQMQLSYFNFSDK